MKLNSFPLTHKNKMIFSKAEAQFVGPTYSFVELERDCIVKVTWSLLFDDDGRWLVVYSQVKSIEIYYTNKTNS